MALEQTTLYTYTRGSGYTSADGYLDYDLEGYTWQIPQGKKVIQYSCDIYKITSQSDSTIPAKYGGANISLFIEYSDGTDTELSMYRPIGNPIPNQKSSNPTTLSGYVSTNVTNKTIDHLRVRYAIDDIEGKRADIRCKDGSYIALTVYYEDLADKVGTPTNVKLAQETVGPNTSVALTWSASSKNNNNTVYYQIYENVYLDGPSAVSTATQSTSGTVKSSSNNNTTRQFFVRAWGDLNNDTVDSSLVTLKTSYTNPLAPTNIYINGASTLYIGVNNIPKLTLSWKAGKDGTNNAVSKYRIYKDGTQLKEAKFVPDANGICSYALEATLLTNGYDGEYTVQAIGTISNTQSVISTTSAVISYIPAPPEPKIENYDLNVNSSATYIWSALPSTNQYQVSYQFSYTKEGSTQPMNTFNVNGNQYIFEVSKYIEPGTKYKVTITTIFTATGGGTTTNSWTTEWITRISSFTFNKEWIYYGDPLLTNNETSLQHVWKTVKLTWPAAVADDTGSNSSFKYDLYYSVGTTANWGAPLKTGLTTTSTTIDVSKEVAGAVIQLYVRAYDQYGNKADSNVLELNRLSLPSITDIRFGAIDYNSLTFVFDAAINTAYSKKLIFSCELAYDQTYENFITNETLATLQSKYTETRTIDINLNSGITAAEGTFYSKLYNQVVRNKTAMPAGKIRITVQYDGIADCMSRLERDFNYNFITPFTGDIGLSIQNQEAFYNPGDEFTIDLTPPTWKNAAGGTDGVTISYLLTGNGHRETLDETLSYDDIAPSAEQDLTLSYNVVATATWDDGYSTSVTLSSPFKVNIARWSSNDAIGLSQVERQQNKISGYLNLAGTLSGSLKYKNIKYVFYQIYANGDAVYDELQSFGNNQSSSTISIYFQFDNNSSSSVEIYAKIWYTNTSEHTPIERTTATFLIRPTGIPMAIRKGRVGINVDSEFNYNEDNIDSNSALYIIANKTAPVLELSANSGEGNRDLLIYYKGPDEVGRVSSRNDDAISISGLTQVDNTATISATTNWNGNNYRIANSYITSTTIQEILPRSTCSAAQVKAFQKANFIGGNQSNGWCEIISFGTKPTIDIPITLIVRGG